MTIALIICIPITALVVGFLVLKSVQLGLKWQLQVAQKQTPTLDLPKNPIAAMQEKKEAKEVENIFSEWLNGPKEG